ncbi:MAG: tetratricopeptide repeat protein [Polyangiaceae bacterium]|nr:tetratricopeptide repeat protein [Polyangiaceae bacterium]
MSKPSIGVLRQLVESAHATIEEGAFIIAQDAYPNVELPRYRAKLDALAEAVVAELDRGSTIREQVAALSDVLYRRGGLRGNRGDYYDPRNSYLTDVLDRGLGIPISLSVVILAIARRSGIVAEPVGFPGHFIVRIGGPNGLFIDPFDRARILSNGDLLGIARKVLGESAEVRPSHLEPVALRTMLVRMLSNLRGIHEQRNDHRGALVVCDRLVELDAGAPARRDRGLHALALGARAAAASDLAYYLKAQPQAPDRVEIEGALARASLAASWN